MLKRYLESKKSRNQRQVKKEASIEPSSNDLIVDFEIVYKNPLIRNTRKEFKLSRDNLSDIYSSRTFCLYEDIDMIKSKGLAKGGSLENAICS